MLARVEDLRHPGGTAETVEDFEGSLSFRTRRDPAHEFLNPHRTVWSADPCTRGNTVPHRGGGIAVDVPEVPLAVDERVAHRERLRESHQRVVDRLVAVRVVGAHHVANHARAL